MNVNFRVFRRNNKNLILLWSSKTLTPEQQENLRVYAVDGGAARELAWRPFSPDNPDKFAPDVAGVVVSHSSNGLDPALPCVVRVVFGTEIGEVFEIDKEVDPANATPSDRPAPARGAIAASPVPLAGHNGSISYLYAYNYDTKEWVPLPWTAALQGKTILVQEQP